MKHQPVALFLSRWRHFGTFFGVLALAILAVFGLIQPASSQITDTRTIAIPTSDEIYLMPWRIIAPRSATPVIELKKYKVDVSVKDNIATTSIDQTFVNRSNRTLEAKYLYPLPEDANFSTFTLTINGKAIEGQIMEKDKARQTYTEIVRKLIDPGLLEYLDSRTVQASVAPIMPGEEKVIHLSYTQLLKQDGGLYRYQYPLGGKENANMVPQDTGLSIKLQTTQPLKTLYSPSHTPKIDRDGDKGGSVSLNLNDPAVLAQKAFVLYYSQDNQTISLNSLAYKKSGDDDGYFLMTLRSPLSVAKKDILAKDIILVLDTSGSMSGQKIVQAKDALKYIVNHLQPTDRFNIVQFNTDVSTLKAEPVPATAENVKAALAYVDELQASGSTNIEDAIKTGFSQLKGGSTRPGYMIFLTDGEPTVGITDTEGLMKVAEKANTRNTRIFTFGVGYDVKTILLSKLAGTYHGSATFVEPEENLELALTSFYNKIVSPVLTDVQVDFSNLEVSRIYPAEVGDLFAGSEVILLGRFKHGGDGKIVLSGKSGKDTQTFSYPVKWEGGDNTQHAYLPRLWAGRRIGALLDNIRQNGENAENKEEVISLSKKYGIITPYTSFLAMEPQYAKEKDMLDGHSRNSHQISAPGSAPAPMAPKMSSRNLGGISGGSSADTTMSSPLGISDDLKNDSGRSAVRTQKALGKIQQQANAQALEEAQSASGAGGSGLMIQTLGEKTFMLKEGVWTDTTYDEAKNGKPQQVTFGTDAYFKLLGEKPELVKYFSLGQQVLVVIDGKAYQVVSPQTG